MTTRGARCQTPFGVFDLQRYPARRNERLQAWNSADILLLESFQALDLPASEALVVNDEHGALTAAIQPSGLWTDSHLSATSVAANLARNDRLPVTVTWSTDPPPHGISCAVMRIPKQAAYFEYQLSLLAETLPDGASLLASGMDKHLSPHTAATLERCFGPTERHPGKRRARVFHARRDGSSPAPAQCLAAYHCEALGAELYSQPNVFSREQLDIGSRFLLQHLEALDPAVRLVDLACGNGVLGLAAFHVGLAERVSFSDESALALKSARNNALRLYPEQTGNFSFFHGDGLLDFQGEPPQLILCNPPFHSEHTVDDFAGKRLAAQAASLLPDDGRLCLVANRHLDYGAVLRQHCRRVRKLAGNDKFNLWLACKR